MEKVKPENNNFEVAEATQHFYEIHISSLNESVRIVCSDLNILLQNLDVLSEKALKIYEKIKTDTKQKSEECQ